MAIYFRRNAVWFKRKRWILSNKMSSLQENYSEIHYKVTEKLKVFKKVQIYIKNDSKICKIIKCYWLQISFKGLLKSWKGINGSKSFLFQNYLMYHQVYRSPQMEYFRIESKISSKYPHKWSILKMTQKPPKIKNSKTSLSLDFFERPNALRALKILNPSDFRIL